MFEVLEDLEGTDWISREFLASAPSGPHLAALVAAIDPEGLSGTDRVHLLRAQQRMASFFRAAMYRTMVSIVEVLGDAADVETCELAAAEIRAALRLTRRTADVELSFALDLTRRMPQVLRAFGDGAIDLARARAIVAETAHLSNGGAGRVADAVIGEAPCLTTGQLRVRIRELCAEVDAADAERRYRRRHADRRVVVEATPDGTAHLHAFDLAPHDAQAIATHIHRTARATTGDCTGRTMDQRRADAFVDLCRTARPHAPAEVSGRGSVDIVVDVRTLAGLTDRPGDLGGYGPVVAEVARTVAVEQIGGRWSYTLTDGDHVIGTGPLRRRPPASLRRIVEARDRTCVFPGCRMPSGGCDLDHRVAFRDGGATTEDNLSPLCRHDHRLKSTGRWRYERRPDDHEWTSPLGLVHTTSGRPP